MARAQTMEEWREQMKEYISRRDAAMAEAGIKPGDTVEYHAVSPFHEVEIFEGVVYIQKNERPMVRLKGGGSKPWHKGWTLIPPEKPSSDPERYME